MNGNILLDLKYDAKYPRPDIQVGTPMSSRRARNISTLHGP
jgi:hypothetical protein